MVTGWVGGRATGTRTDKPELKPVVASSGVNARGPRCGTARAFGRFLSFFLSFFVCMWRAELGTVASRPRASPSRRVVLTALRRRPVAVARMFLGIAVITPLDCLGTTTTSYYIYRTMCQTGSDGHNVCRPGVTCGSRPIEFRFSGLTYDVIELGTRISSNKHPAPSNYSAAQKID
jgi:hypothetical protein